MALQFSAYNNRHQKRTLWALDSQQVARVCGGRYAGNRVSRFFSISMLFQILLIMAFLVFGWQADQAMDKSGVGNVEAWRRFNGLAGTALYGTALLWMATIALALFGRAFSTFKAQVAIGGPPLFLVIGWFLSWVV